MRVISFDSLASPEPLANDNIGVKSLAVKTKKLGSDEILVISTNPDTPQNEVISYVTGNSSELLINFPEQPFGYPNLSELYVVGSGGIIRVETDPHWSRNYFTHFTIGG